MRLGLSSHWIKSVKLSRGTKASTSTQMQLKVRHQSSLSNASLTISSKAVGKIPLDVNKSQIDLMSISGHKLYGPKGIGACYVRRRPRVRLEPIISGGGQERGLRSGTLAPPLVIGFGEACRIAKEELEGRSKHIYFNGELYINDLHDYLLMHGLL